MKIFIASKLTAHSEINNKLYTELKRSGIDPFLPENLAMHAKTSPEMCFVADKCYNQIDRCDIVIIVAPIGLSVASEIGYAINQKMIFGTKELLLLNIDNDVKIKEEAMIIPYIDREFRSIGALVKYIADKK